MCHPCVLYSFPTPSHSTPPFVVYPLRSILHRVTHFFSEVKRGGWLLVRTYFDRTSELLLFIFVTRLMSRGSRPVDTGRKFRNKQSPRRDCSGNTSIIVLIKDTRKFDHSSNTFIIWPLFTVTHLRYRKGDDRVTCNYKRLFFCYKCWRIRFFFSDLLIINTILRWYEPQSPLLVVYLEEKKTFGPYGNSRVRFFIFFSSGRIMVFYLKCYFKHTRLTHN